MPSPGSSGYNEYMRTYMLKRYHARRRSAIVYLGGCCVKCQSKRRLEIDHKKPATKSFTVSGSFWNKAEKIFWREVRKCQLLCHVCHLEKTRPEISASRRAQEARKRAGL